MFDIHFVMHFNIEALFLCYADEDNTLLIVHGAENKRLFNIKVRFVEIPNKWIMLYMFLQIGLLPVSNN